MKRICLLRGTALLPVCSLPGTGRRNEGNGAAGAGRWKVFLWLCVREDWRVEKGGVGVSKKRGRGILICTPKVRHKTFGVFFMKYSYEQRLIIVSRVKQGELIAHLSKEYHINEIQTLAWVRMWDKYGRSGLEQQPHCRPAVKLKEEVVRLILEKGVPLVHVRIEYRIGKTALQRWVSTVRKYGYEALNQSKRRGKPQKELMGRPKKKEPQTELERLQAENLRLRAENALLKKAKALVEAKKAQILLNGREPSTN